MIKAIVLHFGYVEESFASFIVFTDPDARFSTRYKAIQDLARNLLNMYHSKTDPYITAKCCKGNKDTGATYCPDCGRKINRNPIELEGFSEWVDRLWQATTDGWGYCEEHLDWWPWNTLTELIELDANEIAEIREKAEDYLTLFFDGTELDGAIKEQVEELWNSKVWWLPKDRQTLIDQINKGEK